MVNEKEREIALYYLRNIADEPLAIKIKKYELLDLIEWIKSNFEDIFDDNPLSDTEKDEIKIEAFMKHMRRRLSELAIHDIAQEGFDGHLDNLFRKFDIANGVEREVLRYLIYFESVPLVTALGCYLHSDCTFYDIKQCLLPFSWFTGVPAYQIGELFSSSSPLVNKGILYSGNRSSVDQISLNRVFANMAYSRGATESEIRTRFLGVEGIARLKESDFSHIADDFKRIRNIRFLLSAQLT